MMLCSSSMATTSGRIMFVNTKWQHRRGADQTRGKERKRRLCLTTNFLMTVVMMIIFSIGKKIERRLYMYPFLTVNDVSDDMPSGVTKNQKSSQCPLAVQKNVGILNNVSLQNIKLKESLEQTVLLVSSNFAYRDLLSNWEYLARYLQLKWAVLALDDELYQELGNEKAVPPQSEYSVSGPQKFRRDKFNTLSCNKMRMVLSVVENCNVDVVFSDVDNIFYRNPFEHDLGRLIMTGKFDYIYQSNSKPDDGLPRNDRCLKGEPRREANTGFYYMSKDSQVMKDLINSTLQRCSEPDNKIDDQTLFWEELWKKEQKVGDSNQTATRTTKFHHCDLSEYEYEEEEPEVSKDRVVENGSSTQRQEDDVIVDYSFNFCCLDPYYYPIGLPIPPYASRTNSSIVTYHANGVIGKHQKIQLLRNSRRDRYGWDGTRTIVP